MGRIKHLFGSIEEQIGGTASCCFCKGGTPSRILGPCNPHSDLEDMNRHDGADLAMTGSPCNPFSIARSKRFHPDSVQEHAKYEVTDKTIDLMIKYEPKKWVFEQVMGFTMPFHVNTTETPKQKFLGLFQTRSFSDHFFSRLFFR